MQNALKRLLELREELEALHRTTARVLAESEQLIVQMHESFEPESPRPAPARGRAAGRKKPKARPR